MLGEGSPETPPCGLLEELALSGGEGAAEAAAAAAYLCPGDWRRVYGVAPAEVEEALAAAVLEGRYRCSGGEPRLAAEACVAKEEVPSLGQGEVRISDLAAAEARRPGLLGAVFDLATRGVLQFSDQRALYAAAIAAYLETGDEARLGLVPDWIRRAIEGEGPIVDAIKFMGPYGGLVYAAWLLAANPPPREAARVAEEAGIAPSAAGRVAELAERYQRLLEEGRYSEAARMLEAHPWLAGSEEAAARVRALGWLQEAGLLGDLLELSSGRRLPLERLEWLLSRVLSAPDWVLGALGLERGELEKRLGDVMAARWLSRVSEELAAGRAPDVSLLERAAGMGSGLARDLLEAVEAASSLSVEEARCIVERLAGVSSPGAGGRPR